MTFFGFAGSGVDTPLSPLLLLGWRWWSENKYILWKDGDITILNSDIFDPKPFDFFIFCFQNIYNRFASVPLQIFWLVNVNHAAYIFPSFASQLTNPTFWISKPLILLPRRFNKFSFMVTNKLRSTYLLKILSLLKEHLTYSFEMFCWTYETKSVWIYGIKNSTVNRQ